MSVLTDDNHMWDELVAGLESDAGFRLSLWVAEVEELASLLDSLREEVERGMRT